MVTEKKVLIIANPILLVRAVLRDYTFEIPSETERRSLINLTFNTSISNTIVEIMVKLVKEVVVEKTMTI